MELVRGNQVGYFKPMRKDPKLRWQPKTQAHRVAVSLLIGVTLLVIWPLSSLPNDGNTDELRPRPTSKEPDAKVKARAEHGDLQAQLEMSLFYETKAQDSSKADFWLRKAATGGHPIAQYCLGYALVVRPYLFEKDPTEAAKREGLYWLRLAADKGEVGAQYHLGKIYEEGKIVTQDLAVARAWYEKAAYTGHLVARTKIADFYLHGKGGKIDLGKAYAWLTADVQLGSDYLSEQRVNLGKQLSEADLKLAEEEARAIVSVLPCEPKGK